MKTLLVGLVFGLSCACAYAEDQDDSFLSLFPPADEGGRGKGGAPFTERHVAPLSPEIKERMFNSLVFETQACMLKGVGVIRMYGIDNFRDPRDFLVRTCGGALQWFMVKQEGVSEAAARGFVVVYADWALSGKPF